jgi:hypothetical protein
VVIVDEPGMGKSTTLAHLTEGKIGSSWVIRLNLKDCQQALERLPEQQPSLEQANNFLWEAAGGNLDNTLATGLLTYHLKSTTAKSTRPLLVLLDVFDEIQGINSDHQKQKQEKVILLLQFLKDKFSKSSAQVWVTTRRHRQLENRLGVLFTTEFEAFGRPQQTEFLWKFWKIRCQLLFNKEDNEEIFGKAETTANTKLSRYADALLAKADNILGEKMARLMGIPLQMRILAEGFQDEFANFARPSDAAVPHFETLNVLEIYQRFIETKYTIYFKKKTRLSEGLNAVSEGWVREALTKRHRRLGFQELFREESKAFLGLNRHFRRMKLIISQLMITR